MSPFFRGYHPSELDKEGKPLPTGPGPLIVVLVFVTLIVGLIFAAKSTAEITAIYPKKVCETTSLGKDRDGGIFKSKQLLWGVVSLSWCERRSGKHQGDVVGFKGPLTNIGITSWGKKNNWVYEGMSKTVVKCVDSHEGYCTYLRVKIWHEFDQRVVVFGKHHTMKFSLLVGNGAENWR